MRSLRLALLSTVGAVLLAACGTQPPQLPAAPQVSVNTSDLSSLSLKVEPKSPDLSLLYQVNGGSQQEWDGSTTTDPNLAGACPGNNSLTYSVKWKGQTLVDHQSTGFFYDPNGALTVGGVQAVQWPDNQALNLNFPITLRTNFGCAAVVSAQLDGGTIQASVAGTPPVVSVSAPVLSSGSHNLTLTVQLGAAVQTVTVPVTVGTASGGTSSGGTSTGGTSTPSSSVTGVSLQPTQLSLKAGGTAALKATVTGTGGFDPGVTFTSDHPNVATVDAQGNVNGIAAGQATITATSKQDASKTATSTVTVAPATQGSFQMSLAPASLTIKPGSSDISGLGIITYGGYNGLINLTIGNPPDGSGLTLKPDRTSVNPNVSAVLTVYVAANASAGRYTIPVTASDGTLSSTAQLTITVSGGTTPTGDTQKPVIGSVSLSGSTLTSSPAGVTVAASDNVAVSSVTLAVDGGSAQRLSGTNGSYSGNLDLSNLQNGSHSYLVTATDSSGNSATASGNFTVQISGRGPSVLRSLSIGNSAPGTGAYVESGGTVLIGSGRQVLRIDPSSGTVTARSATLDGSVVSLAVSGSTLYIATAGPSLWSVSLSSLGGENKISRLPGNPHNFAQSGLGLFLSTEGGIQKITGSTMTSISTVQATSIAASANALFSASAANRQIVQMDAAGSSMGKTPIIVSPAWIAMNAAGSGLNVATATGWNLSYLDPNNWTLSPKANLRALAVGVAEYNNQVAVLDNVGNLVTPDGNSQQLEKAANASFGPVMSGSTLYAATDSGTLYVYSFNGSSASYLNKTAGLGKLGAPLAVDSQGRIYYPNAAGTLYILQPGN